MLFLFFAVGSLADCNINSGRTACEEPLSSSCETKCSLYPSPTTCATGPNCTWTPFFVTYQCGAANSSLSSQCRSYNNSIACEADSMCGWKTSACKYEMDCVLRSGATGELCYGDNASHCTSQTTKCEWNGTCTKMDRCKAIGDKTGCVASDGCFWETSTTTGLGKQEVTDHCRLCFEDPDKAENMYQLSLSRVDKLCTNFLMVIYTYYTGATPAATGCTGGSVVAPPNDTCTDGERYKQPSSAYGFFSEAPSLWGMFVATAACSSLLFSLVA